MSNTEHCIEICNKLLRGERSAVETYGQAIEKLRDKPVFSELDRLLAEHQSAVHTLEENVRSMGGEPEQSAGAWGALANTVQGAANLIGPGATLESLQQGEKSGQNDYENALKDDEVMPACKNIIRAELLPMVSEHLSVLERLQKAA